MSLFCVVSLMVFWITAYHATCLTCPNLIRLVPTTWQMNFLQNPIKFDLMHSLEMGRVVPKLQPILGQWVCCWKELMAEWGSLSRNKKEGKRARLLLDDKNEDLPVDLLSVDVHSHCLKRFREREMSSPSHFLLRVGSLLHSNTGGASWINSFIYWPWCPCADLWEFIHKLFLSVVACCLWLVAGRKITYNRMQPSNVTGYISS